MKFFIVTFCAIAAVAAENYCDPSLCTVWGWNLGPHIACPGYYQNKCEPGAREIVITPELRQLILDKHNRYRDDLAGGRVHGFERAAHLPEMTWDDELAFIASKNAMNCDFAHDKCRNTRRFKQAGQNLAYASGNLPENANDYVFIEDAIKGWWDEHKDCDQRITDQYPQRMSGRMILHFTAMAHEHNYKVGCAASHYQGNTRYLVCNYATVTITGKPVYKRGRRNCKYGYSQRYPNLCASADIDDEE
ncbi:antigen 5 like allergen Cul n 1-like [Culicoides brevitarsis]|uniref:antigen 5 like allergen Cul n 1-like n=1 Tax=Culicoides brevitarsis TaxID=469753 RepID=UPI00307C40BA